MQTARMLLSAIVVLVAVAWLVRVPVPDTSEPHGDLPPSPTAEPPPPDPPIAGNPSASPDHMLAVHALDPSTLRRLSDAPIAFTAGPVEALNSGSASLLVGTTPLPRDREVQVVRVAPPTKPLGWAAGRVPAASDRVWTAAGPNALAWTSPQGRLIIARTDVPWRTARLLPDGHRVIAGGFVTADVMTIALTSARQPETITVWTVDTSSSRVGVLTISAPRGRGDGPSALLHAIDLDTQVLHVLNTAGWTIASTDLATTRSWTSVLSAVPTRLPSGVRLSMEAAGGRLVIHELPGLQVDAGMLGTWVLMGDDHQVVAHDPHLRLHDVTVGAESTMVVRDADDQVQILTAALQPASPTTGVGALTAAGSHPSAQPTAPPRLLGTNMGTAYVQATVGQDRAVLLAVDMRTGRVVGRHTTDANAVFLADGPLLVTSVS